LCCNVNHFEKKNKSKENNKVINNKKNKSKENNKVINKKKNKMIIFFD
jgi:hypothetical protein